MAAHDRGRHEPVDRPVAVDHEVRAHARQLVQLGVALVAREVVEHRLEAARGRVVLDDHVRVAQAEVVDAVVALGVVRHVGLALVTERDRLRDLARWRDRAGHCEHRVRVAANARARQRAARQLDDEGAVAGEAVVLPGDGGAVVARQAPARQAAARGVEALDHGVAGALHHHAQRLVVPERHARLLALDEALHHLGLGLGGGAGAGLVHAVLGLPAVGEVAVQVHAVRVVTGAGRGAIRVGVVHEPERGTARRAGAPQAGDHRTAGRLVAVHLSHHEHLHARARAPDAQRADRPVLRRAADRLPAGGLGRGRRRAGRGGGHDACEEGGEQHPPEYGGRARVRRS